MPKFKGWKLKVIAQARVKKRRKDILNLTRQWVPLSQVIYGSPPKKQVLDSVVEQHAHNPN